MVQDAKKFGPSVKKYLILKYLHNLFEVDRMTYVLRIKHMLKPFVVVVKHKNF